MATNRHLKRDGRGRPRPSSSAPHFAAPTSPLAGAPAARAPDRPEWMKGLDADELELVGFAGRIPDTKKPKLTAFFAARELRERRHGAADHHRYGKRRLAATVPLRRRGQATLPNDVMLGTPVGQITSIGSVHGKRGCADRARRSSERRVLRPLTAPGSGSVTHLSSCARAARHAPRRDHAADGNVAGVQLPGRQRRRAADTWYAGSKTARLARPFLNRGVPPHFKYYDAPFLRWGRSSRRTTTPTTSPTRN